MDVSSDYEGAQDRNAAGQEKLEGPFHHHRVAPRVLQTSQDAVLLAQDRFLGPYLGIRARRLDGEPGKQRDKASLYCRLGRTVKNYHVHGHIVIGRGRLTVLRSEDRRVWINVEP